jgi:hypothetical protein
MKSGRRAFDFVFTWPAWLILP